MQLKMVNREPKAASRNILKISSIGLFEVTIHVIVTKIFYHFFLINLIRLCVLCGSFVNFVLQKIMEPACRQAGTTNTKNHEGHNDIYGYVNASNNEMVRTK